MRKDANSGNVRGAERADNADAPATPELMHVGPVRRS